MWVSFIGQRGGPNNTRFFGISFYQGTTDSANERFTIGEPSNIARRHLGCTLYQHGSRARRGSGRTDQHANHCCWRGSITMPTPTMICTCGSIPTYPWASPRLAPRTQAASVFGTWHSTSSPREPGQPVRATHGTAWFDEIRIGNRFNDVIPEPASMALALLSVACVASLPHRRRIGRNEFSSFS